MKKTVLSVLSVLLTAVLLTGCAAQPAVSSDAPETDTTTTTAVPTTTTTTVTTTITAKPTTITTTTAVPTTAKTKVAATTTAKPTTTITTTTTTSTTTKPTTKNSGPEEYAIRFKKDTSVGWEKLHKKIEKLDDNQLLATGSYIVDGDADIYLDGKWVSIRQAVDADPTILEKVWKKATHDDALRMTGQSYDENFIKQWSIRGDGLNYAKYTGFTLLYWTSDGDSPSQFPCPVHEYPGIGDRKWDDLSEKEQQDYMKALREYEHTHQSAWYVLLPPDEPIPTWDDIYEKGICYMDF